MGFKLKEFTKTNSPPAILPEGEFVNLHIK
jgi:hypothetical protein